MPKQRWNDAATVLKCREIWQIKSISSSVLRFGESGGELVEDENGVKYKDFYGMFSTKAQQTYYGDLAEHRAPEGKKVRLKLSLGLYSFTTIIRISSFFWK